MSKKIVVVNADPRAGWNTDTLITEAGKGAVRRLNLEQHLLRSDW